MPRRRTQRRRGRRRRRRGRSRWTRLRRVAALLAVLAVLAAGGLLYLYVDVTSRFEGRLWELPARVYSDRLLVRRGLPLDAEALVARLERSGYARTPESPSRPGQYRVAGTRVELRVRPFEGAEVAPPSGTVTVQFRERRVAAIRDAASGTRRFLELEPELLATLYGPRREERLVVPLERIPLRLVRAVLAIEDRRFYRHGGLDARGLLRAAWTNARHGRILQGGSTITQQTVKNLLLSPERSVARKLREALTAVILEWRYPKERILEVYLNEVYLGQRGSVAICGVEAAARFYFGRGVVSLTTAESALLAGLIRSPGTYNPFVAPEQARKRRDVVLDAMHDLGFVDDAAFARARDEPLRLASGGGGFESGSYAVDFVAARLAERIPRRALRSEGLRVMTTIDTTLQRAAEEALREGLARLERDVPAVREQRERRSLQGAMVVLEPETGALRALVGGRAYGESQFNRAVQASRQPGSCFKPFVYLAGFELGARGEAGGLTPATPLSDEPLRMVSGGRDWAPSNYDGRHRGVVSARRALEESLNVPTVRAAQRVGLERIVEVARASGLRSALQPVPSLALGTMEVTPLELASAYGTLARQGMHVAPRILRQVRDGEGRAIGPRTGGPSPAVRPEAAFLVTDVLRGVFERGTARSAARLGFRGTAAGKTGTTDDTRDAWFVGYSPDLLALVWVGYDDNARTGLTGATGALPIWVDFARRVGLGRDARRFRPPSGVLRVKVCADSGLRPVGGCDRRVTEMLPSARMPLERCDRHTPGLRRWFRNLRRRGQVSVDR